MKISVSLPDEQVAMVDEYARTSGLHTRSAVIQRALATLRHPELEADYAAAWDEWKSGGDEQAWAGAATDGLDRG